MTQIKDLPEVTSVADADELHLQASLVDKKVSKLNLLKDIQLEVDTNASGISTNATDIANNIASIIWEFKTGGGVLLVNHKYIIGDSLGYTMPPMGDASEFVGLSAHGGVTPTMTVDNVTAAEHFIKAIDLVDNGDTTFQIDAADNGKEYLAISNATDWEM